MLNTFVFFAVNAETDFVQHFCDCGRGSGWSWLRAGTGSGLRCRRGPNLQRFLAFWTLDHLAGQFVLGGKLLATSARHLDWHNLLTLAEVRATDLRQFLLLDRQEKSNPVTPVQG
jgi:hypothetical protein